MSQEGELSGSRPCGPGQRGVGWAGKGPCLCRGPAHLSQWPCIVSACALQDVSFSLSPGKVTALVGPSGSGKSSCVNILQNFYPLQGGRVLLDGKPIGAYDHKFLHRAVRGGLWGPSAPAFSRPLSRGL